MTSLTFLLIGGTPHSEAFQKVDQDTGYSFWDGLCNFVHKFTWIVLSVHTLNKLGKFW